MSHALHHTHSFHHSPHHHHNNPYSVSPSSSSSSATTAPMDLHYPSPHHHHHRSIALAPSPSSSISSSITPFPSSSSTSSPLDPSSSSITSSAVTSPSDATITKKRRGRQPRQSLVGPALRSAIARFTSVVGAPVLQPAGFRDFNGWLHSIAQPAHKPAWMALVHVFVSESQMMPPKNVPMLKKDVIHEIINNVVKRKSHESVKLVSTNARRQSSIPTSGNTVMTIFEGYLATVGGVAAAQSGTGAMATVQQMGAHDHHHHSSSSSSSHSHHHHHHHNSHSHHHHPSGFTTAPHASNVSRQASYHSQYSWSSPGGGTRTSPHHSHHHHHRNISIANLSGSKSSKNASNMNISALLTDEYPSQQQQESVSRRMSSYSSYSTTKSKLPSVKQLDEQIRKERRS